MKKILVTGGAGFIGSEFVRQGVRKGYKITVVDKITYAGDLERLKDVKNKITLYRSDICNKAKIDMIFKKEKPGIIVHFAAETHVDRSIESSGAFIETNIKGTQILLDVSKKYKIDKFVHISTDEVYGDIKKGKFYEDSPLKASSPYAASKAAADLLIKSYIRTYNFPAIIVRPSNNYGPWQYPEKFIPLSILRLLEGKKIPVYGKGKNIREWLYVSDCAQAIWSITKRGKIGQVYNVGSSIEKRNIDVAKKLVTLLGKSQNYIKFVKDRPGHDFRYFLDTKKIKKELGWNPKINFDKGLRKTLTWCLEHRKWMLSKK
ncbi:MAG: dTDP-glucose 4,6-dehydratase [Omnitrophica bacterium]|nr:dTDP-glucose 4,6-dehydratase [Candidatus Omnitrophota bacterium]